MKDPSPITIILLRRHTLATVASNTTIGKKPAVLAKHNVTVKKQEICFY